jgi:hypothetical protein
MGPSLRLKELCVAHSLEESLSSIIVKKSNHSAGMVTVGSPGSLWEKYLAHILNVAGRGVFLLASPTLSPTDVLSQVELSN